MTRPAGSPPDRKKRAQRLARTYGGDRDGWERVEEYQRAVRWHAEHPQRGSSAASSALDLPRGRLRGWFNGGKPDPVHALEFADTNGWLDAAPGDRVFEALSVCHAWIVAGGSIQSKSYVPLFTINPGDPETLLEAALDAVGVGSRRTRDQESSAPQRAAECRPARNAPILGRFLAAVFKAPQGAKRTGDLEHPSWLGTAPFDTRLRWCRVYVSLRGTSFPSRSGYTLQLAGERSIPYLNSLRELLAETTGLDDDIRVSGGFLRLRERAAAMLDVSPELPA